MTNLRELDTAESRATLTVMDQASPTGIILTNEILNLGAKSLNFAECLKNEFRAGRVQFRNYNFIEGVKALLVDKGRPPIWKPAKLPWIRN